MNHILVTGGATRLGAAICKRLAEKGHSILIHYRASLNEAESVAKECRSFGVEASLIQGDLSSTASVEKFCQEILGQPFHIKGLVNNVGNYLIAPLLETEISSWDALFQTNFFAPVAITKALIPSIRAQEGGIVNIGTSGLEPMRALTEATAYAASKSALWFYTRSLAKEMASHRVNVNMISPGYLENSIDLKDTQNLPMKRAVLLEEVVHLVAYLFDQAARSITGQNIEVAGGINL